MKRISRKGGNDYAKEAGKKRKKSDPLALTNNNRAKIYAQKPESYYERYLLATSWREMPPSKAMVDRLTKDMMEYVGNPKTLKLRPFFLERFLRDQLVVELTQRFPEFAAAYETAKQIIGERREDLAVYKQYETNPQAILPTLRHYSPDWRKTRDEDNEHEEKVGAKIIVLEEYENPDEKSYEELEALNEQKRTPEEVAEEAIHATTHQRKKYNITKPHWSQKGKQ